MSGNAPRVLVLPEPCVVVLIGIAGCGKSTFAGRHFSDTEVLSSDRCRALVADDEADQSATADAFAVLHFIADRRIRRGRTTVVDATNLTAKARKRTLGSARAHSVPAVAVVLDLPFEVCRERNAGRRRVVDEDVLRQQQAELERASRRLKAEGYAAIHVLQDPGEVGRVRFERQPWSRDPDPVTGPR